MRARDDVTEVLNEVANTITTHTVDKFGYDNGSRFNKNGEIEFVDAEVNRHNETCAREEKLIALLEAQSARQ